MGITHTELGHKVHRTISSGYGRMSTAVSSLNSKSELIVVQVVLKTLSDTAVPLLRN